MIDLNIQSQLLPLFFTINEKYAQPYAQVRSLWSLGRAFGAPLSYTLGIMKITPFEGVGILKFGTSQSSAISILGLPTRESVSGLGELELHYPSVIYRFDVTEGLDEITFNAPLVEFQNESVNFENLEQFLRHKDQATFETVGFIVSPELGIAFDPNCPPWVTVFPKGSISFWRK